MSVQLAVTSAPVPVREQLVVVRDLQVRFAGRRQVHAVRGLDLEIAPGEAVAIVGESGSGKSVTARSLVGLAGPNARVDAAELTIGGVDARRLSERGWRSLRGGAVGLVLQDALGSLDPLRTVGAEISEVLATHRVVSPRERPSKVLDLLAGVGIPDTAVRARQFPHQLSGGLRQRALIASALAGEPALLIADEPTTALDVTVQAKILRLLDAQRRAGTALLLISHDLAVVSQVADRILVMHDGVVVEQGPAAQVLADPQDPYTRALLAAVPSAASRGRRLCAASARSAATAEPVTADPATAEPVTTKPASTGSGAGRPVLVADDLHLSFELPGGGVRHAVDGVTLRLAAGRKLGVVGESGSGKSTLAQLLLGLVPPDSGSVSVDGRAWADGTAADRLARRRSVQLVAQDPLGAFDPRYSVREVIGEPLRGALDRAAAAARVAELCDLVHLEHALLDEMPRRLSGGQRQRVAIARALALAPEVLVCDEPVSALDVSIQAQVLDLLDELSATTGTALVLISHDLGVVHHLVDDVLVMRDGKVVEDGPVDDVFVRPQHPYTRELVASIPRLGRRAPTPRATGPFAIRLVEPQEHAELADLLLAAFTYEFEITELYRRRLLDVPRQAAEQRVWVAVDDGTGQLLGSVTTPLPDAPSGAHDGPDDELTFGTLGVGPQALGRGVGSALVRHVLALARERGKARVVMYSGPQMRTAHRLYEHLGFVRLPERETVVVDGGQRLLCFGLELGDE